MTNLRRIFYSFFPWLNPKRGLTVRYTFPLALTLAAFFGAAAIVSNEDSARIVLEVRQQEIVAGRTFEVDVFVVAGVPVNAVDLQVTLPPSQVRVLGIDTGESVITLWTEQPYVKNGAVHLTGGTYRRGFIGKHRVATINARALTSGLAYLGVSHADLYAGDGTGARVTVASTAHTDTRLLIAQEDGTYSPDLTLDGSIEFGIVGDLDGDGRVTLQDISVFMSAWNKKDIVYDLDGDSRMTFRDFGIILSRFFFQ